MQVVVLGMHRSGTSALTGLLARLGCYPGPAESLPPPSIWNQRGYWEHSEVAALDEALLAALGASWYDVLGLDAKRLHCAAGTDLPDRARRIVSDLDDRRPWVIKDPRLCVLFPFWRPLLERPVCVLIHRDPLSVARSLQSRDGFPIAFGVALWELHARAALTVSVGVPRILVSYRRLLSDPLAATRALRDQLTAAGVEGLPDLAVAGAAEFIERALERQPPDSASHREYLNAEQAALCDSLATGLALLREPGPLSRGAADLLRFSPPTYAAPEAPPTSVSERTELEPPAGEQQPS